MMPIQDVQFTDQRWLQFWENYRSLEHQVKAIIKLGQQIKQADPGLLTESAEWVDDYRQPQQAALVRNPLNVKWQSQLDNKSGSGSRECFSSS